MAWCGCLLSLAERIDKVWYEIFFQGAFSYHLFFVSDDDFVVGDFDDLGAGDGKLGIEETFDGGAFDDDLLDAVVVFGDGKI